MLLSCFFGPVHDTGDISGSLLAQCLKPDIDDHKWLADRTPVCLQGIRKDQTRVVFNVKKRPPAFYSFAIGAIHYREELSTRPQVDPCF